MPGYKNRKSCDVYRMAVNLAVIHHYYSTITCIFSHGFHVKGQWSSWQEKEQLINKACWLSWIMKIIFIYSTLSCSCRLTRWKTTALKKSSLTFCISWLNALKPDHCGRGRLLYNTGTWEHKSTDKREKMHKMCSTKQHTNASLCSTKRLHWPE